MVLPTEQEARDMLAAINAFQVKDNQVLKVQHDANIQTVLTWWNTLGINIQASTTRTQAKIIHTQIESLLQIETDRFRRPLLEKKT